MAQDYILQKEKTMELKSRLVRLAAYLLEAKNAYLRSIEKGHQIGMSIQMYDALMTNNAQRMSMAIGKMVNDLETIDLQWVSSILDAYDNALNAAGCSSESFASSQGSIPVDSNAAATQDIKECDKKSLERIILMASDSGREENHRDIHRDYLAAILKQQSR